MSTLVNKRDHGKFWNILSEEDWQQILRNKLKTSDFKILKSSTKPFSEVQVGFMGEHLILQTTVELNEVESPKQLNLNFFGKALPRSHETYERYCTENRCFIKEYRFYLEVIPDLKKHQNGNSVSWTPICYLATPDILILENLADQDFQHYICKPSMDYKHCVVALKTIAHLHAESVIFEEKEHCTISEKHSDILFETCWVDDEKHPGNGHLVATITAALNLLEHLPDYKTNCEKYKRIREKLPSVIMEICEFSKPSTKYRNVICHGDIWATNIFFRYARNGEPTEVRLVDFQLFRYNPPAHDIMCFLYWVSDKKFRDVYLEEMLSIYYSVFASVLRSHSLDPDKLQFSWQEFKDSCDYYRRGAQISTLLYYQNILMDGEYLKKEVYSNPEDIKNFLRVDKTKYVVDNYLKDSYYRERNNEALQEVFENCILNQ